MNRAPLRIPATDVLLAFIFLASCGIDDRAPVVTIGDAQPFGMAGSGSEANGSEANVPTEAAPEATAGASTTMGIDGPAPISRVGDADTAPAGASDDAVVGALLSADSVDLTLGPSVVGQVALGSVTLTNTGGQPTSPITASVTGPDATAFTLALDGCAFPLQSGEQCALGVQFVPREARNHTATLQVAANVAGALSVALQGRGLAPGALVGDAEQFDYGLQEVNTTSQPFTWSITNTGSVPTGSLTVSTTNADFAPSSGCSLALAPQASCSVVVSFRPGTAGDVFGTISVSDESSTATLSVSGRSRNRLTVTKVGSGTGVVRSSDGSIDCGDTCSALPDALRVDLSASTTNGSDSIILGWSESNCEATAHDCSVEIDSTATVTVRFELVQNNLVFVSSRSLSQTLGSLEAYDAACNEMGNAAGINNAAGNGFIAALSSSTSSLRQRLGNARGFRRMDGRAFSDTLADLFDRALIYHAVRYNELGVSLIDYEYATGTLLDGSPGNTCLDWTSGSAPSATFGFTEGGPSGWTGGILGSTCAASDEAILCMGNRKTAPLVLETFTGKRMWLSNTAYQPGSMTPDAKCQSERPPGVSAAVAFVAYRDRPAAAALTPGANYVRADGQLIGSGADIASRRLLTGIWTTADGQHPATRVWTGANTPNDLAAADSNCSNWQATSGRALTGVTSLSSERFWADGGTVDCSTPVLLYCVEP